MDGSEGGNPLAARYAPVLPTITGALALIVITFVAQVWGSVLPEKQRMALMVVNASGAHFILSMLLAIPVVALSRFIKSWALSASVTVAYFVYTYWALLIQHKGLADVLLVEKWVSVFPLTSRVFPLLDGTNSDRMFYFLPLALAWGAWVPSLFILYVLDSISRPFQRR